MKVLLDHNLARRLRRFLPGHLVVPAQDLNVHAIVNGALLAYAEQNGFEVLLTADQNLFYQQNNLRRKIALVVLTTSRLPTIMENLEKIEGALAEAKPGSFTLVEMALPPKKGRKGTAVQSRMTKGGTEEDAAD